jgi:hypothetical protein
MNISDGFFAIFSERKLKTVNCLMISNGSGKLFRTFVFLMHGIILVGNIWMYDDQHATKK